jgi:hypothetical protein
LEMIKERFTTNAGVKLEDEWIWGEIEKWNMYYFGWKYQRIRLFSGSQKNLSCFKMLDYGYPDHLKICSGRETTNCVVHNSYSQSFYLGHLHSYDSSVLLILSNIILSLDKAKYPDVLILLD